jgi:hypothetical protein
LVPIYRPCYRTERISPDSRTSEIAQQSRTCPTSPRVVIIAPTRSPVRVRLAPLSLCRNPAARACVSAPASLAAGARPERWRRPAETLEERIVEVALPPATPATREGPAVTYDVDPAMWNGGSRMQRTRPSCIKCTREAAKSFALDVLHALVITPHSERAAEEERQDPSEQQLVVREWPIAGAELLTAARR